MTAGRMAALAVVLAVTAGPLVAQRPVAAGDDVEVLLQRAMHTEQVEGRLPEAIEAYKAVVAKAGSNRPVAARALLQLARAYDKLARPEARATYQTIVRDYADQAAATEARTRLARLPGGASQATQVGLRQEVVWKFPFAESALSSVSPDGRYVAWLNWPAGRNTGSANLAVHDLLTGQDRDVTQAALGSGFATSAFFSPNGRSLVYGWFDFKADQTEVRTVELDGSNERTVFRDATAGRDAIAGTVGPGPISPDGRLMAATIGVRDQSRIGIGNLATGELRPLKSMPWLQPQLGNFSPDGRFFVYSALTSRDSQDREVLAMAIDGSSEARLAAAPGENRRPFFTPDGRHVVFVSNRSGRWDLWAVKVESGKPAGEPGIVKADIGSVTAMGFSRDGTFFYRQHTDETDVFEADIDRRTWKASGPPRRLSDRFVHSSADAHWSPDGRTLAYIGWRGQSGFGDGGTRLVVTRELATGREREWPIPTGPIIQPTLRWFPDQKALLWTDTSGGRRGFRQVDTSTGAVRTLLDADYSPSQTVAIAEDGRSFLFTDSDPASRADKRVVRFVIDSRDQQVVYVNRQPGSTGPVAFHGFAVSRDGRQMAFKKSFTDAQGSGNWSLMLADLSGGEPRELLRSPSKFVMPFPALWGMATFLPFSSHSQPS